MTPEQKSIVQAALDGTDGCSGATFQPTFTLRFILRGEQRILQQCWNRLVTLNHIPPRGATVALWVDVPFDADAV